MDERTAGLNELAQGLRPLARGVVLLDLSGFCLQARATVEDGAGSCPSS
ncbi:hypothetical protein ABZ883_12255 [Streptomyces sp. NPDC046977]